MKKNNVLIYEVLLRHKGLTIKQKIVISQVLYLLSKETNDSLILTSLLKTKIINLLRYNIKTINKALLLAEDLDILCTDGDITYSICNTKYKINKNSNYMLIPLDIFYNTDLTEVEKLILSYCNNFTRRNKSCKITNGLISNNLNISKQVVERTMVKLKKLGFIETRFMKKGFVSTNREILIDKDNIHQLYIKNVEKIEKVEIETVEKQRIKEIKELKVDKIENQSIENLNITAIDMTEYLTTLLNSNVPKEFASKLYFNKKKEFDLVKEIYNKSV